MLTITVETVALMWDDMQSLLVEHWAEVAHDKDEIKLEPDRSRYEAMERDGKLLAIAAREDGQLIGYSVFFMTHHIHYKHSLLGINDVLFVTKEHRGTRAGLMLIRESEKQLKEFGVIKAVWHVKPSNDWSEVLIRGGYKTLETCYGKLL